MQLIETIIDGFNEVKMHAGRTVLQTLGVVLGVASVVATVGLTEGSRQQSLRYYAELGGVLKVSVRPKPIQAVHLTAKQRRNAGLTLDDVNAVRSDIGGVELSEPLLKRALKVQGPESVRTFEVSGVEPGYAVLNALVIDKGRFVTAWDHENAAAVCVLGADRAHELFGSIDPIGRNVRIGDTIFHVVGVMRHREFYWSRKSSYNALDQLNKAVYVPLAAMLDYQIGPRDQSVDEIGLRLTPTANHRETVSALKRLLLRRHSVEDFQIDDHREQLNQMNDQGKAYKVMFEVCGLISLITGGIVVANIVTASFTERIREVGIRKALGAKDWHIAVQVLVESSIVSGLGGTAGLLVGNQFVRIMTASFGIPATLTTSMIASAVASACAVGLISGIYPAFRASRIDPVVALRCE